MKVTVDRIEEGICVCIGDDGDIFDIPRGDFPFDVKSCDILDITLDGGKLSSAELLTEETAAVKARASAAMDLLRKKFKK